MRHFTTPEQTAKLIELGFEKPKGEVKAEQAGDCAWYNPAYSIGELIEILPPRIGRWELDIFHDYAFERWVICFHPEYHFGVAHELADALYNLIVKLKKDGVI